MVSRIETGAGIESKFEVTKMAPKPQSKKRFDKNYGAMSTIMGYLPRIEQLQLQGLDTFWYTIGVGRVQWLFALSDMLYLVDNGP